MTDDQTAVWEELAGTLRACRQKLWKIQEDRDATPELSRGVERIAEFLMFQVRDAEEMIRIENDLRARC